jgi:hypothetical protein
VARQRKKPDYQYDRGAYSTTPTTQEGPDGTYVAEGSIQSWRGSVQDLVRAAEDGVDALREDSEERPSVRASLTDWHGEHRPYETLEAFERDAAQMPDDQINVMRIDIGDQDGTTVAIVARRTIPGIKVSARGTRRVRVDGVVRLVFSQLMRGYIDRGGGIRPILWLAVATVPMALTFGIASERDDNWSDWVQVPFVIVGIAITFAGLAWAIGWIAVKTPLEFVPDDAPSREDVHVRVLGLFRFPWVTRILALLGVVAIGVITNKISDVIPWP